MAISKCDQDLLIFLQNNNISIDANKAQEISKRILKRKAELTAEGRSLDDFVKGSTVLREKDIFFHREMMDEFFEAQYVNRTYDEIEATILQQNILDLEINSRNLLPEAELKKLEDLDRQRDNRSITREDYNRQKDFILLGNDKAGRDMRAWKASFMVSGDTVGQIPLESHIAAASGMKQAELAFKLREYLNLGPDDNVGKVWTQGGEKLRDVNGKVIMQEITDPNTGEKSMRPVTLRDAFLRETFYIADNAEALQRGYDEISSRPVEYSNDKAKNMARSAYEAITLPTYYELNSKFRTTNIYDNTPKVVWKKYKIEEFQKRYVEKLRKEAEASGKDFDYTKILPDEGFVRFLAENLSLRHGTLDERTKLARMVYKEFMFGKDWRSTDNVVRQIKEQILKEMPDASPEAVALRRKTLPSVLRFKDADAFLRVNDLLGSDLSLQEMIQRMTLESGRLIGFVNKLGPRFEQTWAKLKNAAETGQEILAPQYFEGGFNIGQYKVGSASDKVLAKTATEYVEHMINPWINENINISPWSSALGVVKNLEVVKLGSAFISNMADTSSWSTIARNELKARDSIIRHLTGIDFKGTRQESNMFINAYLDFFEVNTSTYHDRFRFIDTAGLGQQSRKFEKILKGSAWISHNTLQWTGFNHINQTTTVGATSQIIREIGTMIKDPKQGGKSIKWNELAPEQRGLFEKFGFNDKDYETLLQAGENALDPSGRFNIHGYSAYLKQQNTNFTSDPRVIKMVSVIRDLSRRMVPKADAIDRAAIGFFQVPGSVTEANIRAVTQFKQFLISHARKVVMPTYQKAFKELKNGNMWDATATTMNYLVPAMIMSYVVVQLKQLVAGKAPYTDPAALSAAMMQYTNIIPVLGDLYWNAGGQELYKTMLLKEDEKLPRRINQRDFFTQLLGPALQDVEAFLSVAGTTFEAGILAAKGRDVDAANTLKQVVSPLTRTLQGLDPLANIWMTKAVWKTIMYDGFLEWAQPERYRRAKLRLEQAAENERLGGRLNLFTRKDLGLE